jgi:hypothetical protein
MKKAYRVNKLNALCGDFLAMSDDVEGLVLGYLDSITLDNIASISSYRGVVPTIYQKARREFRERIRKMMSVSFLLPIEMHAYNKAKEIPLDLFANGWDQKFLRKFNKSRLLFLHKNTNAAFEREFQRRFSGTDAMEGFMRRSCRHVINVSHSTSVVECMDYFKKQPCTMSTHGHCPYNVPFSAQITYVVPVKQRVDTVREYLSAQSLLGPTPPEMTVLDGQVIDTAEINRTFHFNSFLESCKACGTYQDILNLNVGQSSCIEQNCAASSEVNGIMNKLRLPSPSSVLPTFAFMHHVRNPGRPLHMGKLYFICDNCLDFKISPDAESVRERVEAGGAVMMKGFVILHLLRSEVGDEKTLSMIKNRVQYMGLDNFLYRCALSLANLNRERIQEGRVPANR